VKRIRDAGLPFDYPTDVGYFTRLNGYELARIRMPSVRERLEAVAEAAPDDQVPEPIHRANQLYTDRILLEEARRQPLITLRHGWQCTAIREDSKGVLVDVEESSTGRLDSVWAQFVAGCDGANSVVRRSLNIRYSGTASGDRPFFGGQMVNTHVRLRTSGFADTRRRCWHYWVLNPETRTLFVTLDGQDEFLMFGKIAAGATPDDSAIEALARRSVGGPCEVEILGHGLWTAGLALVAERYGTDRVFLCGDSAHLFTPTGGFGMNTGVDDAVNLAWKLAALLQGWGGPGLTASYDAERRPVAIRNTHAADALAQNVAAVPISDDLERDTPAGASARARVGAFLSTFGEEFASLGVQLGARYDGSPLLVSDGASAPPFDPVRYVPSSVPGGRTPHMWIDKGISLFDRLGHGFTLLQRGNEDASDAAPLVNAAASLRIPFRHLRIAGPAADLLYERAFTLVRPDQHVGWRGDNIPPDPERLLRILTGWPA
jgi:2-polyprenyl-6-methoxyphenol hydroxylase-like FAD-dependent oxidoreductase